MAKKQSKSIVYLTLNPAELPEDIPKYFLGTKQFELAAKNILPINVNKIPADTLDDLNTFILNIDSYFDKKSFVLTNALSSNRYISPIYDNILKAWQLLAILKNQPKISLLLDDKNQIKIWRDFLLANNIQVKHHNNLFLRPQIRTFGRKILGILLEYILLKLYKKNTAPFSRLIFIHWINQKNTTYGQIVNSSRYFGEFIKDCSEKTPISILGHIANGNRDFKEIIKSNLHFIKSYIGFFDIIRSLIKSFALLLPLKSQITFKNIDYTPFVKNALHQDFWHCSYLTHLLLYQAFKKIAKKMPNNTTVIYPFENQPWEKALTTACKKSPNKINLLAYQFFPINKNFLIYRFTETLKHLRLIPNKILTSDTYTDTIFAKEKIETIKLGNLRYNKLLRNDKPIKITNKKTILCSTSIDKIEVICMTYNILTLARNIDCNFIINTHPLLSKPVHNKILNIIDNKRNISLSHKLSSALLDNEVFLVIYNLSTAFLDAALRKIPVLYLACPNIINLDRFYGLGKTANDLEDATAFIKQLTTDSVFFDEYSLKVYNAANRLILPYDNKVVEKIIQ